MLKKKVLFVALLAILANAEEVEKKGILQRWADEAFSNPKSVAVENKEAVSVQTNTNIKPQKSLDEAPVQSQNEKGVLQRWADEAFGKKSSDEMPKVQIKADEPKEKKGFLQRMSDGIFGESDEKVKKEPKKVESNGSKDERGILQRWADENINSK